VRTGAFDLDCDGRGGEDWYSERDLVRVAIAVLRLSKRDRPTIGVAVWRECIAYFAALPAPKVLARSFVGGNTERLPPKSW